MTTTTTVRAAARPPRRSTLRAEFRFFCASANAKVEAAAVVVAVVARMLAGPWAGGDAMIVVVLIAVQPLFEWTFHLYVLHYRPVRVFGRMVDFELARKHREHHADPADVALVFVPLRSLFVLAALAVAVCLLALPSAAAACTALAGAAVLLLAYEWTHYLIHSSYQPASRIFRALRRAHRLHHFKNEQYWFGVMSPAADVALGTYPDPATAEVSPTARNLAGLDPEPEVGPR